MIDLVHIHKQFNKGKASEVTALGDVSLRVRKGEFVVLIGSNGSGKTTLLNIIAGAEVPTGGSVLFGDRDVTRLPEYRRSQWIARVFQNPLSGTAPDLSILDNFRLAALRTGRRGLSIGVNEAFKQKVKEQVARLGMGLENKVDLPMGALSGGQRQALTLLMCVMDHTEILLLDEPTAALDPRSARLIMETADQLIRDYGLTAIFITHNLKDAHAYGDRLIQMAEGAIARDLDAAAKGRLALTDLFDWFS
jgi:putative ABC transport system ATP-binding protein